MYYRVDRTIPCRVGIYEGIDIRGDGGYIVGIGSVVDGNSYSIFKDRPIAQANEAVYQFLENGKLECKNLTIDEVIHEG